MRGKRSKQYRKLMQQYGLSFGFREPYQVLIDAEILKDADRFKMDLIGGLERTLHGQVKPMITQCSIRHLYNQNVSTPGAPADPSINFVIDKAKQYERRRCGHLPADYPEPLSTAECLMSVVDPKSSGTNKHRYVVACQDLETRKKLRGVKGVPLVYINRSVMIMEPMADGSRKVREGEERGKMRDGLKKQPNGAGEKRKRDDDDDEGGATGAEKKKKKVFGKVKGPNPLSVKRAKKGSEGEGATKAKKEAVPKPEKSEEGELAEVVGDGSTDAAGKKKRRRKHKPAAKGEAEEAGATEAAEGDDS